MVRAGAETNKALGYCGYCGYCVRVRACVGLEPRVWMAQDGEGTQLLVPSLAQLSDTFTFFILGDVQDLGWA